MLSAFLISALLIYFKILIVYFLLTIIFSIFGFIFNKEAKKKFSNNAKFAKTLFWYYSLCFLTNTVSANDLVL